MKKVLSLVFSFAFVFSLLTSGFMADAATVRETVVLAESGFENGLEAPFYANESDPPNPKSSTLEEISLDNVNSYLHIGERTAGQTGSTAQHNVLTKVKEKGIDGKFYVSMKIRLDNANDTAYAAPLVQGTGFTVIAERKAVNNQWTELGKKGDNYIALSGTLPASVDAIKYCKFYVRLFSAETGQTSYDGGYSIDDVNLWFVPSSQTGNVTAIGENYLTNGNFEDTNVAPDFYDTQIAGGDSWYVAVLGGEGTNRLCKLTVKTESDADTSSVYAGKGSILVKERPGNHQGIAVKIDDMVSKVGPLAEGEGYSFSIRIRAKDGETFKVRPTFGSTKGTGFINGQEFITVTDEWMELGLKTDGTRDIFKVSANQVFDPYGGYAALRLVTDNPVDYYVDDFKVFGPQPLTDIVEAFVSGVDSLPAPSAIARSNEALIVSLEKTYANINQDNLDETQKAAVAGAKAKLDAVRVALDALPMPRNSFAPEFKYENKANLIAPYGDLETFTKNDFVWNEENVENERPRYTLVEDKNIAFQGNNCLLISNREKSQNSAAFTLTDVVKDNGGSKYYFSAWMKTKNPGEEMDVFPLLYIGGIGKEFYIDSDARYTITNEWTFVGVSYDNLDGFYRSQGEEVPDLEAPATYVALRFYGQNESLESAEDGEMYPDYYIDALKVWKEFDGQASYVDPDLTNNNIGGNGKPKPTTPTGQNSVAFYVFTGIALASAAALIVLVIVDIRKRKFNDFK